MVVLSGSTNLVSVFLGYELLSIPLYVLCATHLRREHSLESGLKYLIIGSVGSATLLYGLAFVYGATGSTDFSGIHDALAQRRPRRRRPVPHGARLRARRAGVQGVGGAVSPVDAGRLRGRADAGHRVHGRGHQGGRARRVPAAVRRRADQRREHVGAGAGDARGDDDRGRQRGRDRPVLDQADAGLFVGRAVRLHAVRCRREHEPRREGDGLLHRRLRVHEPGRVRGRGGARARDPARRRHHRALRARQRAAAGWPGR